MKNLFKPATKKSGKLRLGICGPAGAGKTMTALRIAMGLCPPGGKIAVIDTEEGSASLYESQEVPEGIIKFDVLELRDYNPSNFTDGIKNAGDSGYDVIVIDSITHAWYGVLDEQHQATQKSKSKNSYMAWRVATPMHNAFVQSMLSSPAHVIATMRSKVEHVSTVRDGRKVIDKVGMAPIQRDGMDYEFTIVLDMDQENNAVVTKSRCSEISGKIFNKPGGDVAAILKNWLGTGATPQEQLDSALSDAGISAKDFTEFCESKGKIMETEAQIWSAARWIEASDGTAFVKGWIADRQKVHEPQPAPEVKPESTKPETAEAPAETPASEVEPEVKKEVEKDSNHLGKGLGPVREHPSEPPTKVEPAGEPKGVNVKPPEVNREVHESWNDDEKRKLYNLISDNLFSEKSRPDMPKWGDVIAYCQGNGKGTTPEMLDPEQRKIWADWYNRSGFKKVKDFVWSESKRKERVAEGGA